MKLQELVDKLKRQTFAGAFKAASAKRNKRAFLKEFKEAYIGYTEANPDVGLIFELAWDGAMEWMINELRIDIEDGAALK